MATFDFLTFFTVLFLYNINFNNKCNYKISKITENFSVTFRGKNKIYHLNSINISYYFLKYMISGTIFFLFFSVEKVFACVFSFPTFGKNYPTNTRKHTYLQYKYTVVQSVSENL